jgi:hypothetical protein
MSTNREACARYHATAKGRARMHKYNHSPARYAAMKRYYSKPDIQEQQRWIRISCGRARRIREGAV